MADAIAAYLKNCRKELATGKAGEHSYRSALKALVQSFGPGILATNEPKRVECGAPDLIVLKDQLPIGYIECKDIDVSLDAAEKSEQMKRYLPSLANLILTDYLEFRYYVAGERKMTARIARVDTRGRIAADTEGAGDLRRLFEAFLGAEWPSVGTPRELARRMAKLAQLIRDTILAAFEREPQAGKLHAQMEGFREVLLHDLTPEQFADMYAQTISYGLFAARCNVTGRAAREFNREHAAFDLPKTNPFLRSLFGYMAGADLDERITWVVDDLAELLRRSDIARILEDFGRAARREDPVVHFYETFLAEYDPKMREARGVYYTPEPVVSYIVRSVDHILKNDFDLPSGLADDGTVRCKVRNEAGESELEECPKVQILDPAAGTGTFLHRVIREIHAAFAGNEGLWSGYVSKNLLGRVYGFELLMAPYAVAHMKLGLLLKQTGYDFGSDERLNVFLTNTLEEAHKKSEMFFAGMIAHEANEASKVKKDVPVMVILGNPPYSGHSANKGKWIKRLIDDYKTVDGKPLGEKNPKWLNDDYVKFIRFAQWRIERTGYGVLAFISNHGYLDNPTFRGMRQSLMETFDDIYILDLHGNTKKKEVCPDGSKDENVFDIQQGVAIGIFVKKPARAKAAVVRHAHCHGLRGHKYAWLAENDAASTEWETLQPDRPFYVFIPQDVKRRNEYETGWKITSIMPVNGVGMTTARDHVVIDFKEEAIIDRAKTFRDSTDSDKELCSKLNIPMKKGWDIPRARKLIKEVSDLRKFIKPVLYRPFDARLIFYHDSLVWRTVKKVMRHMLAGENVALLAKRQGKRAPYSYVFVANLICESCVFESAYANNSLFPLYLYPKEPEEAEDLFEAAEAGGGEGGRRPNLADEFIKDFSERLKLRFVPDGAGDLEKTFGPEDVFHYTYAVFHSPTYRTRYAEFLKIDFPRLPLTSDVALFRSLAALGAELVGLHLLEKVPPPIAHYPKAGSDVVEKVRYTPPEGDAGGRVRINKTQYFDGVAPEVWKFHVGGYQVAEKWLKDRKGRKLSYDEINRYRDIITALGETIRIMADIDRAIPKWPIE